MSHFYDVSASTSIFCGSRSDLARIGETSLCVTPQKKDRVAVFSGGGAGHEPMSAGWVGDGLLTACVQGNLFASPSVNAITTALNSIATEAGILLIVLNYTGDRLNFGLASERCVYPTSIVFVADDISTKKVRGGARGLLGALLVSKIAGEMSSQNRSLNDITSLCKNALLRMGTLGVCIESPLCPPGLGVGIHGEAGVRALTSGEIHVDVVMNELADYFHSNQPKDTSAIMMVVNNLGGFTLLEFAVVVRDATHRVLGEWANLQLYLSHGTFQTSLSMSGFSICLFFANTEELDLLLAPTSAPAWVPFHRITTSEAHFPEPVKEVVSCTCTINDSAKLALSTMIKSVACEFLKVGTTTRLNKLDSILGDADCGSTLQSFAKALSHLEVVCLKHTLERIANLAEMMGGTSGALYSLFFTNVSKNLPSMSIRAALAAGVEAVQFYGQAQLGDRSLIDALSPSHCCSRCK